MKLLLSFKHTASAFFLSLLLLTQIWALNIVDIEETTFARGKVHKEGKRTLASPTQVRLVDFDVTNQQVDRIIYLMTPQDISYTFSYKGVTLEYKRDPATNGLTVELAGKPDADTWFVGHSDYFAYVGDDGVDFEPCIDDTQDERTLVKRSDENFLSSSSENLKKFFSKLQKKRAKKADAIEAEFINMEDPFLYTVTGANGLYYFVDPNPHAKESGIIGEVVADLTFFAHGFTKKTSKLNGDRNNGFDGVYFKSDTDPTKKQLWIVEAKLHDKSRSEDYFDGEFSKKLTKKGALASYKKSGDANLVKTGQLLDEFITRHPQQIFFLGYDVMSDGRVKAPFMRSYGDWFPATLTLLTTSAPEQSRRAFLGQAVTNYVQTSSTKESPIALAKKLLEAAGLTGIKVEKED